MNGQSTANAFRETAGISIGWSVVMIVLGFTAVLLPLAAGVGVSILVGWIMVAAGLTYAAYAFGARDAGSFLWRMLAAVFYVVGGTYFALHPGLALESLTLAMAVIFFVEAVTEIIVFFQFTGVPGSTWFLFDGIITLLLAYVIWRPWPLSSLWAIGTLLGINLIVSGFTRAMYSVAARKTVQALA
jgi:uncharacterized membrane protein HdeD (DUF308 family)